MTHKRAGLYLTSLDSVSVLRLQPPNTKTIYNFDGCEKHHWRKLTENR